MHKDSAVANTVLRSVLTGTQSAISLVPGVSPIAAGATQGLTNEAAKELDFERQQVTTSISVDAETGLRVYLPQRIEYQGFYMHFPGLDAYRFRYYNVTDSVTLININRMTTRSLSKKEASLVLAWESEKRRLVGVPEVTRRLRCSHGYARKLLYMLHKKGWIEPVAKVRGRYILIGAETGPKGLPEMNPYLVARTFPKPYFLAYRAACTHHGLLTQLPTVMHVAVRRLKLPMELMNVRFQFVVVSKDRFFGAQEAELMGEKVFMSDLERSVLDALDRPDLVGGIESAAQVMFEARKKADYSKLLGYMQRFNDSALARRFGYIAEALRLELPADFTAYLRSQVRKDPAYLGTPRRWGKEGERDKTWNLILNVPQRALLGEVHIG